MSRFYRNYEIPPKQTGRCPGFVKGTSMTIARRPLLVGIGYTGACLICGFWIAIGNAYHQSIISVLNYAFLTAVLVLINLAGIKVASISVRLGKLDICELPIWYGVWTMASIAAFGWLGFTANLQGGPLNGGPTWLPDGLWLLIVGCTGMWIGYRIGSTLPGSSCPYDGRFPLLEPSKQLFLLVYAALWVARLWRLKHIGVAFGQGAPLSRELLQVNQLSIYFEESVYLLVAIAALQVFRGKWNRWLLRFVLALELSWIFLSGFMKPVLWLFLVLLGTAGYARKRLLQRGTIVLIMTLVFTGSLLVPLAHHYRRLISSRVVDRQSLNSVISGVVDSGTEALSIAWRDPVLAMQGPIIDRQIQVAQTLGIIVNVTPRRLPYWGSKRLFAIPFYVIPRAIWHDKPYLSRGVVFGIKYLGAPQDTASSAAYTIFGDLYLSASWEAVFLGMLILGIIQSVLYKNLVAIPLNRGAAHIPPMYLGLAVGMMDVEGSYIGVIVGLIHRLLLFGFLFFIIHLPSRMSRARMSGAVATRVAET
jgi:hypothetical protein